jgi:hypothetical protein
LGIHAGKADDASPAIGNHAWQDHARQPDCGIQINIHDLLPLIFANLKKWPMRTNGGVIDKNINPAEMVNTCLGNRFGFGLDADIAHCHKRVDTMFAHFGGNGFGGVTITAAIYDDVKSGLRQLAGDATADILS